MHYFGKWEDPDGALAKYNAAKEDLHAGKVARAEDDGGLTVYLLTAKFLTAKKLLRDAGELSVHTFNDYASVCRMLNKTIGRNRAVADLGPDDFAKIRKMMTRKGWGLVRVADIIARTQAVFNFARKQGLTPAPVYGDAFKRPSRKNLKLEHQERYGKQGRMFTAAEIRTLLGAAAEPLRTMILLAVNAGLGNADLGRLPLDAIDLKSGWLDYPRHKTAEPRRCWLWPETMEAVREWLKQRPTPKRPELENLIFLTAKGDTWAKDTSDNPVSKEMAKLLASVGLSRPGLAFYALRHTTNTVGEESLDFPAVKRIMGHSPPANDMSAVYREKIADDRLRRVSEFIRSWLFSEDDAGDEGDILPMRKVVGA